MANKKTADTEKKTNYVYVNVNQKQVFGKNNVPISDPACEPIAAEKPFYNVLFFNGTMIDGKDVGGYTTTINSDFVHIPEGEEKAAHTAGLAYPEDWNIRLSKSEKDGDEYKIVDQIEVDPHTLRQATYDAYKTHRDKGAERVWVNVKAAQVKGKGNISKMKGEECVPFSNKDGKEFYSIDLFPGTVIDGKDMGGYTTTIDAKYVHEGKYGDFGLRYPENFDIRFTKDEKQPDGEWKQVDSITVKPAAMRDGINEASKAFAERKEQEREAEKEMTPSEDKKRAEKSMASKKGAAKTEKKKTQSK